MNLEEQIKVLFFSFMYGMFLFYTIKLLKKVKTKKIIRNILINILFFICHAVLFYLFLYKINGGITSFYIVISLLLGVIFCKVFYFDDN